MDAEATRLGSRALFYSACLSLLANFVLPLFITKPSGHRSAVELVGGGDGVLESLMKKCTIGLPMLWATSHALFAVCMFATFFVSTVGASTTLITFTGFSWAITQWAPFSLLGEAILLDTSSIDDDEDGEGIRLTDTRTSERVIFLADDENEETRRISGEEERHGLAVSTNIEERGTIKSVQDGLSAKAGVILGLHNIFIVVPQFMVTGLAAIIFAILDPTKSVVHHPSVNSGADAGVVDRQEVSGGETNRGQNSVAIIFRVGGVAALVAFVLSLRLARELKRR